MNAVFPEVKKNFGFGCMRLPMKLTKVDYEKLQAEYPLYNMSELHSDIKFTI